MKQIIIPGTTSNLSPDDKPALGIFGRENTGKTRLAATAPGPIGLLALDKNSKRTFEEVARESGTHVIANDKPLISDKDAIAIALTDGDTVEGLAKIKATYIDVVTRTFDLGMKYAAHPDIATVVVDTSSQLFDWVLFSHFGRRNQIKPTSRGSANQDMIDFVNAMRSKNLILIHRAKEIWKSTGQTDRDGAPIKEPSGKFEMEGFKNIGYFLTLMVELTAKPTATKLTDKFRVRVITCKSRPMLEGSDLHESGVSGDAIDWDNLFAAVRAGGSDG